VRARRPVRSAIACRNAGPTGADRSPAGSCERIHSGSASEKITACAVKLSTPASRGPGCGRIVTPPSAGGYRPAATASSIAASGCAVSSGARLT
jgi:hypothetical protein